MTALPRRRTPRLGLLLATGLLTTAALAGCSDDGTEATDGGTGDPSPTASRTPADPASDTATPSDDATAASTDAGTAATVAAPLYFVGDTPMGPRLYREFQQVGSDNPLEEAAARVTGGQALDPDYSTLFPGGSFANVTATAGTITATVSDDAWTTPAAGMSKRDAKLAVQQLVYTLQGVTQARDALVVTTADGTPTTLFGIDTSSGVTNAKDLNVLSLVSVSTPAQDAKVSGSFTADGVASSFEANVPWEVRQGDKVVKKGFSTAEGWMDKLYPWSTEVDVSDLAPGDYTFVVLTDDPSGGEGSGPFEDSKAITVG